MKSTGNNKRITRDNIKGVLHTYSRYGKPLDFDKLSKLDKDQLIKANEKRERKRAKKVGL